MIRYIVSKPLISAPESQKVVYIEAACNSTDVKPVDGIATGSIITEADTATVFIFDETTNTWNPFASLAGE